MALDRYDKLILEALQKDGRISNVHLANLSACPSPPACAAFEHSRIPV